tara:strand:- start:5977 stop:6591 length:615 start_codon:yes stop_codon:yes gene_type:complete
MRSSRWTNNTTNLTTTVKTSIHGDISILQEGDDVDRRISAHYDSKGNFIINSFLHCLQTRTPIPFKDNWLEHFYGHKIPNKPNEKSFALNMIKISAQSDPLKIPVAEKPSLKRLEEMPRSLTIGMVFQNHEIRSFPYISQDSTLRYATFDTKEKRKLGELLITLEDQTSFIQSVAEHLTAENTRGQGGLPASIYSEFPYSAYEE